MKTAAPGQQHNIEIHQNLDRWNQKPMLRLAYQRFYDLIVAEIDPKIEGLIVELGSGIGNLKAALPQAICTDLFANPWIDQVENAYKLSFPDHSLSHLILFDVFHHLEYVGEALKEFARALKPGGRIVLFEPDLSLLGWLVYGMLHPEPVAAHKRIKWNAPVGLDLSNCGYYAAQGNVHRLFLKKKFRNDLDKWKLVKITRLSAVSYVASGGYSKKQIVPDRVFPSLRRLEVILDLFPCFFSTRLLVVISKK